MIEPLITGLGVVTAVGRGKADFFRALLGGEHAFGLMQRQGRSRGGVAFVGAEIREEVCAERVGERLRRATGLCGRVALAALEEAWEDARLDGVRPEKIGLIVGGSNLQQREAVNTAEAYAERPSFVKPSYALSVWDTDLCGLCTEVFPIRGMAYTVGGGAASGQLAVMQAAEAVSAGGMDVCVALGALTDLSYFEFQSLRNLGAMGTNRYADQPALACRPFDRGRDGFIYGEACAAVVVTRPGTTAARRARAYGSVAGHATVLAGNRNPNPDLESEAAVIRQAIAQAGLLPGEVDYVNPHGSGSVVGDATEAAAIEACGLSRAFVNATKSVTGHGLAAAGAVEVVATLLQMEAGRLHPSRNLDEPESPSLNWVGAGGVEHHIENALCLSYGFGGLNTALCLRGNQREVWL